MPTYSYRCTECGEAFDIQQAFTDDTLTVCPNCGGSLRKQFNTVGVTFNGSGFYRTDSRAKPPSEGGGGASAGESTGGASSGGSSSGGSSSGGSSSSAGPSAPSGRTPPAKKESKTPSHTKE